jgi:hypothetical protein
VRFPRIKKNRFEWKYKISFFFQIY